MKNRPLTFLVLHLGLAAVLAQPVITNQPQNQTALAGTTVTFSVGATGAPPLTYQWRRHTNATAIGNIPGATNDTLVLTNVQPTSHRFGVIVTDGNDLSTNSNPLAQLIVQTLPSFSLQPSNQSVSLGANVRFLIAVTNIHPPIRYQWQLAGTNLANQTNTTLNLTNVHLVDANDYGAVAMDTVGSVTSRVAHLEIDPAFIKITTGSIVNDGGYSWGCAWGDHNNDGLIDLFVCNYPAVVGAPPDFLYTNNGDGTFTRLTNGPLVNAGRWGISAAWGDYDNDGNLDIFVARPDQNGGLSPNTLYHNNGDGTFTRVISGAIVTQPMRSHSGVWADFDNDGLIDFVAVNWRNIATVPAIDNYLYLNTGDGTFSRVSLGGKSLTNGDSWNVAAADFNNDGWVDLMIPQGGTGNAGVPQSGLLYSNTHSANLTLLTNSVVFTNKSNGEACAWGDYDNDGFLDLFVSNLFGQDNFLYHNSGDGLFTLVTNSIVGLDGGWSQGCAWGDYDNDGWLDLFVANLGPVNPGTLVSIAPENNFLYHNNGDGTFAKITTGSLVNDLGYSTGCAWADYDNDGFLDLFVSNGWATRSENNFLYRNNGNTNSWINIRLIGTMSNRSAIGAKVRVRATIGGKAFWQMREVSGGGNYGSQNDLRANFGLGDATNVDKVRIEWPSGIVQELHDVNPRQFLTITEPPRLTMRQETQVDSLALEVTCWPGFNLSIEQSTDLKTWQVWRTLTTSNRTTLVNDPIVPAAQAQFYRAAIP